MIKINLLPSKEAERAIGLRQQRSLAMLAVVMALLFMFVPWLVQERKLSRLQREIDDVKRQIDRYNEQVKEVQDLDKLKSEVEAKLQVIDELVARQSGPAKVLDDLSVSAPNNLWLIEFSESGGRAKLDGLALDDETVALFMRQLSKSTHFYNVDLVESIAFKPPAESAGPGVSLKRFTLSASLDYFGRGGKPAEGNGNAPPKAAEKAPPQKATGRH